MTATEQVSSICQECGAPLEFPVGATQARCEFCEAGFAVAEGTRLVRLSCPRCGGNFYYLDGSMAGNCPYCEARLLAVCERQVLRYVVRPAAPAPQEAPGASLTLLPFWHLAALMYAWNLVSRSVHEDHAIKTEKKFSGRVIDLTLPDPATTARGVLSLRHRGAVFPLEPFVPEHEQLGQLVRETLSIPEASDQAFTRAIATTRPVGEAGRVVCRRLELAAERLSLIYYPFWLDGERAWDAVSGAPESLGDVATPPLGTASDLFDSLRVLELACPACGEALVGGNRSLVLPCSGCERFFRVTDEGLQPFQARFARPLTGGAPDCWLPFWRVEAGITFKARRLQRADEVHSALGVPRVDGMPAPRPDAPPCYFAPAFGALRAPRIEHAARDMTRLQIDLQPTTRPGTGELFHCFFSDDDARGLAYGTWLAVLPTLTAPEVRTLRVQPGPAELWFVPFERRGRELVNQVFGGAYDVATFSGVRH